MIAPTLLISAVAGFEFYRQTKGKSSFFHSPGSLVATPLLKGIRWTYVDSRGPHHRILLNANTLSASQAQFISIAIDLILSVGLILVFKYTSVSENYLLKLVFVDSFAMPLLVCKVVFPILGRFILKCGKLIKPEVDLVDLIANTVGAKVQNSIKENDASNIINFFS